MRATTRKPRRQGFALLVGAALVLLGCPAEESGTPVLCTPGQTIRCGCTTGAQGAQRCRDDGSGYLACVCTPRDGGVPDAEADAEAEDTETDDDGSSDAPPGNDLASDTLIEPDDSGASEVADEPPDEITEEPDASSPNALGADCSRARECASEICLGLTLSGTLYTVCAEPCCHEEECPLGFGCLQAGAGRYCLPSRIFPAGFTFLAATGDSCGPGGAACKSGICDTGNDRCRGTCCTDAECIAAPCHWSQTGSTLRTFCDPLALLSDDGRTGAACTSELDCRSGVCAISGDPPAARCADLCCGPADCPGATTCGLVEGLGGAVVRACVETPTGANPDGAECADDGESCQGGHCVEGRCRSLCCTDDDCVWPRRCLPRTTGEGVLAPVCANPETE